MEGRIDASQDLTLIITRKEKIELSQETSEFFESPLRGLLKESPSYIYLAYSHDKAGVLEEGEDFEMGKILLPQLPGDAWLINLNERGLNHLEKGWDYGVRYDNKSKLFIKIKQKR
jgi:hypothetical protein